MNRTRWTGIVTLSLWCSVPALLAGCDGGGGAISDGGGPGADPGQGDGGSEAGDSGGGGEVQTFGGQSDGGSNASGGGAGGHDMGGGGSGASPSDGGAEAGGSSSGGADPGSGGSGTGGSGGSGTGGSGGGDPGSGGSGDPGSGGSGTGGAPPEPENVRFEYYHDGEAIHYVSEWGGTGQVTTLAGAKPATFQFEQADIDETGRFSHRRTALIYRKGASLYRLLGQADAEVPPPPAQVSDIDDISVICNWGPVSHPTDPSKSYLRLSYSAGASCMSGLVHVLVPFLAEPTDSPEALSTTHAELRDPLGNTDAYLRLSSGILSAVSSLNDAASGTSLLPLTYVSSYYAYSLGDGEYFLIVQKGNALYDIHHYDTLGHVVSAPLLSDVSWVNGPGGHRNFSEEHLFFTATSGATNKLYRLKKDGTETAQALANVTGSIGILGVVDGYVYYSTSGGVYRVAQDADFSTVTASTVIADPNITAHFMSLDRIFYTRFVNYVENRIGVVKLDGSGGEEITSASLRWAGCIYDSEQDRPLSPDIGLCSRVYAVGYYATKELRSYDASPGEAAFFTDLARGPAEHGELGAPPSNLQYAFTKRWVLGEATGVFPTFQVGGITRGCNGPCTYQYGIFFLPLPGAPASTATSLWHSDRSIEWLN